MKPIFTLLIFSVVLTSCKKEVSKINSEDYLANAKVFLEDSLSKNDFLSLDFSKAVLNKVDSADLYFLRVPFYNKPISNDFVLVKTDKNGKVKAGRIIHLDGKATGEGQSHRLSWEGNILIGSLKGEVIVRSAVHNGYITALHPKLNAREQVLEAYNEIVVT